ncbi:hypothetical protein ACPCIR_05870 [Mycobacterium sp. NPDC051198]
MAVRRGLSALMMTAVVVGATACGTSDEPHTGSGAAAGPADPNSQICTAAKQTAPKADALLVALIVDRTASARTEATEPPDLGHLLAEVQAKGLEDHTGSAVQTVGVSGTDQFPTISTPMSLDLKPGDTSQNADNVRAKLLKDCTAGLLTDESTLPKGDNTDLIGALLAAQQQQPAQIIVISSGLNSTPAADLTVPPADPAQLAAAVKTEAPDFASWSIPVTWFSLGEPNPPLSSQDRDRVIGFWKSLLGDKLIINTRE